MRLQPVLGCPGPRDDQHRGRHARRSDWSASREPLVRFADRRLLRTARRRASAPSARRRGRARVIARGNSARRPNGLGPNQRTGHPGQTDVRPSTRPGQGRLTSSRPWNARPGELNTQCQAVPTYLSPLAQGQNDPTRARCPESEVRLHDTRCPCPRPGTGRRTPGGAARRSLWRGHRRVCRSR